MASLQYQAHPSGEFASTNRIITGHDIDGDGINDAIFTFPDAAIERFRGGGVFIYRGTPTGLETSPVRVLSGDESFEEFGFDIQVADMDGDGNVDMVVSSRLSDLGGGDAGAVFVYKGTPGAWFSEDPIATFTGLRRSSNGARLGCL